MKKKGELTTQQIVLLIIAIVSFAILLYFFVQLNFKDETNSELCHNSVIMRSKAFASDLTPLNCKTTYVCLTKDGSCEKMTNPEIKKVDSKEGIYRALAEELKNCWWMFGEGKVNYAGSEVLPDMHCSICSQVAFDNSIKEILSNSINKKEFYQYLSITNVSKDITYSEYLYETNEIVNSFEGDFGEINLDNQYYVLMGITSDVSSFGWALWIGGASAVVAGGIALAPFTFGGSASLSASLIIAAGSAGVGGAGGGFLVAPVVKGLSGQDYIRPNLVEVNSKVFEKIKCESVNTLA